MNFSSKTQKNLLLFSFGIFGFSALVYQVVFAKKLMLLFGLTAPAVATVLAVYFSGLALGSLFFGKLVDRSSFDRISKIYSGLFILIGAYGLLFPLLFKVLNFLILSINQMYPLHFAGFNFFTFLLAFLFLIFPAVLIGGGFPTINKMLIHKDGEVGTKVSAVYFIETFGSVLGVLFAGFWLIPTFGNNITIFSAAILSLTVGSVLLFYFKKQEESIVAKRESFVDEDFQHESVSQSHESSESQHPIFLYALFITGFLALALEVLYTKVLILFIGSSTYAFSIILVIFLLGISI